MRGTLPNPEPRRPLDWLGAPRPSLRTPLGSGLTDQDRAPSGWSASLTAPSGIPNEVWQALPQAGQSFLLTHEASLKAEGGGEWRFVICVLAKVPKLDWSTLHYQFPFTDDLGRERRIDFAILLPSGIRLAIEVDGYDKTNRGEGMSRAEFNDFLTRQNALVLSGFLVLRFSNDQIARFPVECLRHIEAAISSQSVAELLNAREAARKAEGIGIYRINNIHKYHKGNKKRRIPKQETNEISATNNISDENGFYIWTKTLAVLLILIIFILIIYRK